MPSPIPALYAAVDLGSNSFHLQIARVDEDHLFPVDSLKETVRLGGGIGPDRMLERKTADRALEALKLFAERLRGMPPAAVRVVGTNALRVARNAQEFLREAESVLGFPIEIISGREEARLIYLGVAHSMPVSNRNRLVVDVGGGSTEFIIGHRMRPKIAESLYLGCVTFTQQYFPDGGADKKTFKNAELAARREIEAITARFDKVGWKEAVGSSGTAKALGGILQENAQSDGAITLDGLEWLKAQAIKAGGFAALELPGMRADRLAVLPGGLSIMIAVFEEFGIKRMSVADSALRQGVLFDLMGRSHHDDTRSAAIDQMAKRYHVDAVQAERVEMLAVRFLRQLDGSAVPADGDPGAADYRPLRLIRWAARLHEIGISIAQRAFHKHTAYIVANADLPGFSKQEQTELSRLLLGQRGKLAKVAADLKGDPELCTLTFCLRLAVLFFRSRRALDVRQFRAERSGEGFKIVVKAGWIDEHSLTEFGLAAEAAEWESQGIRCAVAQE